MAAVLTIREHPLAQFCLRKICVPVKLVPKARPRVTEKGTYMPPGYSVSKKAAATCLLAGLRVCHPEVVQHFGAKGWPKDASYGIDVFVTVHKSTDGDVDGLAGTIMDAGNGILWLDDRQIVQCCVQKQIVDEKTPRRAFVGVCVYHKTGFEPKTSKKPADKARANRTVSVEEYRKIIGQSREVGRGTVRL